MTHRARQRVARRLMEPRIRFGPAEIGIALTRDYSCPTCRYEKRVAHGHKPIMHPAA